MDGAAVWEQLDQLLARHPRPGADIADVEMHERGARGRIETDAAALRLHGGCAENVQRHARDVEVDGLAERVLAEFCDALAAAAQHVVGRRRTVAADDVDRLFGADVAIDLPQEIDLLRVHLDGFVLAPVAHDPVDLLQRLVVVLTVLFERDGQVFIGVDVVQRNGAGVARACRLGLLESQRTGDGEQRGEANATRQELGAQFPSGSECPTNLHKWSRIKVAKGMQPPHSGRMANAVLIGIG